MPQGSMLQGPVGQSVPDRFFEQVDLQLSELIQGFAASQQVLVSILERFHGGAGIPDRDNLLAAAPTGMEGRLKGALDRLETLKIAHMDLAEKIAQIL